MFCFDESENVGENVRHNFVPKLATFETKLGPVPDKNWIITV